MQYTLDRPGVLTVLPGMSSVEQVEHLLGFFDAEEREKDYSIMDGQLPRLQDKDAFYFYAQIFTTNIHGKGQLSFRPAIVSHGRNLILPPWMTAIMHFFLCGAYSGTVPQACGFRNGAEVDTKIKSRKRPGWVIPLTSFCFVSPI